MPFYDVVGDIKYRKDFGEAPSIDTFKCFNIEARSKREAEKKALMRWLNDKADKFSRLTDYNFIYDEDSRPEITELPVDQQLKLSGAQMLPGFE